MATREGGKVPYVQVPCHLLTAVLMAKLPRGQGAALAKVMCRGYFGGPPAPDAAGNPQPRPAAGIHRNELMDALRCPESSVRADIARLVKAKILVVASGKGRDATYRVSEEYRAWEKWDGSRLLTDAQADLCDECKRDWGAVAGTVRPAAPRQHPRCAPAAFPLRPCNAEYREEERSGEIGDDVAPAYARERDRETDPVVGVVGPDGRSRPPDRPPNDPAEVERVARWVHEKFVHDGFAASAYEFAERYPIDWVRMAFEDSLAMGGSPGNAIPIQNRLRAWQRSGGPPAPAAGPRPSARAEPTSMFDRLMAQCEERRRAAGGVA